MGQGQSALANNIKVDGDSEVDGGYRVFNVYRDSPAAEAGIEVYFDFIVALNDVAVDNVKQNFFDTINQAANEELKILVWSTKTESLRNIYLVPRPYGGPGFLGATVRFERFATNDFHGIRVVEVFPDSPAEMAGIDAQVDFFLGGQDVFFNDLQDLVNLVMQFVNKQLPLYVYNAKQDEVRVALLFPNNRWGGRGLLGCEFGTGLLHRIPNPVRRVQTGKPMRRRDQREMKKQLTKELPKPARAKTFDPSAMKGIAEDDELISEEGEFEYDENGKVYEKQKSATIIRLGDGEALEVSPGGTQRSAFDVSHKSTMKTTKKGTTKATGSAKTKTSVGSAATQQSNLTHLTQQSANPSGEVINAGAQKGGHDRFLPGVPNGASGSSATSANANNQSANNSNGSGNDRFQSVMGIDGAQHERQFNTACENGVPDLS